MSAIQKTIDIFWSKTLLPLIPRFVRPDHFTIVRLLLLPFIAWLFIVDQLDVVFWLTVLMIATDSLDGALARQRKQFSKWGAIIDPLADKLLVILLLLLLITTFDQTALLVGTIIIEFIMLAGGIIFGSLFGKEYIASAVTLSKVKAVCQFFGIVSALLYIILYGSLWYDLAVVLLSAGLILGVLSITYFFIFLVKQFSPK